MSPEPLRGSLEFVNEWTYFTNPLAPEFEDLTSTGPYAGTLEAFTTGQELKRRYGHLLQRSGPTNFWSCSSPRDIATATYFADGFFGLNWTSREVARLHIIPETSELGGNTLTPGDTCLNYIRDREFGHDYGYHQVAIWQTNFTTPIARRLSAENNNFKFSSMEIYSMMEMCGFEILARGSSPWCDVFSKKEWLDFEYARDLLHFYRAGPGNKYAGAMGWLWLNATQNLISQEDAEGVYFSFVHDGDIVPMLAALGIYSGDRWTGEKDLADVPYLPVDRVAPDRSWKTSDLVPMGGRVMIERLQCGKARERAQRDTYVRLSINDGVLAIHDRRGDALVELSRFQQTIRNRGEAVGDFRTVCGLHDEAPPGITFLHQ